MSIRSIAQLKSWFQKGLYPTQSAFWDLLDSFRHREEKIPIFEVDTLRDELNDKFNRAEADQIIEMVENVSASFGEINNRIDGTDESIEALYTEADLLREEQVARDAATLLAANEGIIAGDAATLEASKAYSDQKPHVTDVEKAEWNAKAGTAVATPAANGLMSAVDKTRLDGVTVGGTMVTDAEKLIWNGKADKMPVIEITNFDTFSPWTDPRTSALADGEFFLFSSYNAVGRPASSLQWSGRITKIFSSYFRMEAFSPSPYKWLPGSVSRLYGSTTYYDWQLQSDELYKQALLHFQAA